MATTRRTFALIALAVLAVPGCTVNPPPPPPPPEPDPYLCAEGLATPGGIVPALDPVPDCYVGIVSGDAPMTAATLEALIPFEAEGMAIPLLNGFTSQGAPPDLVQAHAGPGVTLYECGRIEAIDSWGRRRVTVRDRPIPSEFVTDETGRGAWVGIIDTGEPFQRSGFRDVGPCTSTVGGSCKAPVGPSAPSVENHGPHVGGTAVHEEFGIAHDARISWARVLIQGNGATADIIEGIQWFTDVCAGSGLACIGNMSLGGSKDDPLDAAVCASRDAGVLWVVAAGNESTDACTRSPARGEGAITVAASDEGDRMAGFSNQGPCVDITAPGVRITSVGSRGERLTWDGTSMASPHVAGIAALCAERLASTDPAEVRACVAGNATEDRLSGVEPGTVNLLGYAGAD